MQSKAEGCCFFLVALILVNKYKATRDRITLKILQISQVKGVTRSAALNLQKSDVAWFNQVSYLFNRYKSDRRAQWKI